MKLDRTKKYKFAGDVYESYDGDWVCQGVRAWCGSEFQHFADRDLVEEFGPLKYEGQIISDEYARIYVHLPKGFGSKRFHITATEVWP